MFGGMTALLVATGFTGALTLVFLLKILGSLLRDSSSAEAYFSPKGGCTDAVVREINKARSEVLVQAYSFGSRPIAEALVAAKTRGVEVAILLDPINEESASELGFLVEQGLAPLVDSRHAYAHNHVVLIDRKTVLTGSFTFTSQAEEETASNLLVIRGQPDLARIYHNQFATHKGHGRPAKAKGEAPATLTLPQAA